MSVIRFTQLQMIEKTGTSNNQVPIYMALKLTMDSKSWSYVLIVSHDYHTSPSLPVHYCQETKCHFAALCLSNLSLEEKKKRNAKTFLITQAHYSHKTCPQSRRL